MKRLFAFLIAAAMVSGCRAPTPTFDPFQGPPRIPPPGTGQVGQTVPGDSYYSSQPPVAGAPAAPARYTPRDGSYQFRSGAVQRDDAGRIAGEAGSRGEGSGAREETDQRPGTSFASTRSEVSTADYQQDAAGAGAEEANVRQAANWEEQPTAKPARFDAKIRVVEPPPRIEQRAAEAAEPGHFEPVGPVTEISNLPNTRAASATIRPRATIRTAADRSDRGASAGDEAGASTPRFATSTRAASPAPGASRQFYGYDPEYRSLQGRLEFSESENRWKLRYIPIDGQTDKYGGSVILPDSPELSAFEPGDFVKVDGTVGQKNPRSRGFAPDYQLQRITKAQ